MVILAIDTSQPEGSVCLSGGVPPARSLSLGDGSSHLVDLGRAVDDLLREARLSPADLSRVALVAGPGSFTGLRIGLSYAKGLVAALDVDVVTVGTLELLALARLYPAAGDTTPPPPEGPVAVMVDARKAEVYAAVFAASGARPGAGVPSLETLVAPCAEAPELFVRRAQPYDPVYLGTGAIRYRGTIERTTGGSGRIAGPETARPSTEYLCAVAAGLTPLDRDVVLSLEPRYIRSSDAVLKPLKPIDPHEKHLD
jgi:tRNA threonylcarbamoyl adenosine modification protein YeaZ